MSKDEIVVEFEEIVCPICGKNFLKTICNHTTLDIVCAVHEARDEARKWYGRALKAEKERDEALALEAKQREYAHRVVLGNQQLKDQLAIANKIIKMRGENEVQDHS